MDRLRDIRVEAMKRSGGRCEAPDCQQRTLDLQLDHWLGGSGRRKAEESVETVWFLCAACHAARTCSVPSAGHWNALFRAHCQRHGYEKPAAHKETRR